MITKLVLYNNSVLKSDMQNIIWQAPASKLYTSLEKKFNEQSAYGKNSFVLHPNSSKLLKQWLVKHWNNQL